jgi:Tfp pilus assembly protein PilO
VKRDLLSGFFAAHRRFVVICLLMTAANILFYLAAVALPAERIDRLHTRYLSLRKTDTDARKKADLASGFKKMQREVDAVRNRLWPERRLSEQVGEVHAVLTRFGVEASRFDFKPEKLETPGLKKYKSVVTLSGNYDAVKKVLAGIQNQDSIVCIEDIGFRKTGDEAGVTMTLTLALYFT